jgi:hypothetical protein
MRCPTIEFFHKALNFAQNVAMSRMVRIARGIAQNQRWRTQLHYPDYQEYARDEYNRIDGLVEQIRFQFKHCDSFETFLDCVRQVLDLRYGLNHGIPVKLHPEDQKRTEFPLPLEWEHLDKDYKANKDLEDSFSSDWDEKV